jgi:hypothetical protein
MHPYQPSTRHDLVGDVHTMEFHDLRNEKPYCCLSRTFDDGFAVCFDPDTPHQARAEGFDECPFCIGRELDGPLV